MSSASSSTASNDDHSGVVIIARQQQQQQQDEEETKATACTLSDIITQPPFHPRIEREMIDLPSVERSKVVADLAAISLREPGGPGH